MGEPKCIQKSDPVELVRGENDDAEPVVIYKMQPR